MKNVIQYIFLEKFKSTWNRMKISIMLEIFWSLGKLQNFD